MDQVVVGDNNNGTSPVTTESEDVKFLWTLARRAKDAGAWHLP